MKPVNIIFLLLLAFACFSFKAEPGVKKKPMINRSPQATKIEFTFTLAAAARTSAGVFASDSTLVKTLWSGVKYAAGTYTAVWDGTNDEGQLAANGTYQVRVLSNNVTYTWEGVIGNTSTQNSGPNIHRGFERIFGMAIVGGTAYYAKNYSEGSPAQAKFLLAAQQTKQQIFPIDGTGQKTPFVVSDGTNVYWGGNDPFNAPLSFVFATKTSNDAETLFSSGLSLKAKLGRTYVSAIDTVNNVNSEITGMAVQKTGNYLFVAHKKLNQLHVLHKTTGARVQTLTYTGAAALTVDQNDNLWMVYTSGGTARVEKFQVNTDGTLTSLALVPAGLVEPLAVAVSPDNTTLVVADGGSSQQLKAYSNSTVTASWVFGQAGGYTNGAAVTNDKFYFSDVRGVLGTFISFQPDGSFWVSDSGNSRSQHYAADRTFLDRIMFLPHFYSCALDPNNPTRVFSDYLEFSIDYSKPLLPDNGSWMLKNNWGNSIPLAYDNQFNRMNGVTTLSNGKTYTLFSNASLNKWQLAELTSTGMVRFTGVLIPIDNSQLYPDGSLRKVSRLILGQPSVYTRKALTGFDASSNPLWGAETVAATSPVATTRDPGYWGNPNTLKSGEVTTSGVTIAFDGGGAHAGFDNWHLGGIKPGTNKWLWRTAMSTTTDYTGPFPSNGPFDIGNGVQYPGSRALAVGKSVFWGYNGEFWKGGQVNKWNQVYEDGLFVGQFGITGAEVSGLESPPMMAGNAFSAGMVTGTDGGTYLYHNDESFHSGVHRWKVTGLESISEQFVPITLTQNTHGLLGQYFDGADFNTLNAKTVRIDTTVNFNYTNTGLSDPQSFTVLWTGYVQPLFTENYTFFTKTDEGVRLWVNGKLIVDQKNATGPAEYTAAAMSLTAGVRYPVRMEFYQRGGAASAALLYSSASQPKKEIPSSQLYPTTMPDKTEGLDLLKDLPYHQILENNAYGWKRSPATDDYTSSQTQYWTAGTNLRAPDRSDATDLYVKYRFTAVPSVATITRDLGPVSNYLSSWKLSGAVSYDRNYPNYDNVNLGPDGIGGAFLEVLDDQNKVIARAFWNGTQATKIVRFYANDKIITQGHVDSMKFVYMVAQPLEISATAGVVTAKYGNYAAVSTTVMDATANWKRPKTMRLYFWTKTAGPLSNLDRVIDVEKMRFQCTITPPADASCWPTP